MVSKTYSLRPPAAGDKDGGLETLFRVEMKRDDLAAEGLKPGDAVSVVSQAGRGGVGVAWLSIDTAKSQGNSPFIKMHPRLRDFMGLELSDKCSIARYDGPQQIIKTVEIQQSGKHGSEMSAGDLQHWAGIALEQLPCIVSTATFNVNIVAGLRGSKKVALSVGTIASEETAANDQLAVPFRFKHGISKVILLDSSAPTTNGHSEDVRVQPSFAGLPGLEEQLERLSICVDRVNRQVEERYVHLAGCVPILLHGSTGTGKSAVLSQLAKNAGWKKVVRLGQADLSTSASKLKATIKGIVEEACSNPPSLLILDDLHAMAGRQEESASTSSILCEHIQTLKGKKIQVVASARRPIDIDQKVLSLFKKKIELPTPSPSSRLTMLRYFSVGLAEDDTLAYVAERTHAYTATDLEDLCFVAYEAAEKRASNVGYPNGHVNATSPGTTPIADQARPPSLLLEDFQDALRYVHPSLMNELYIEVPKVRWSDIAGSEAVKHKIWEAVELPLKNPEVVSHLNLHLNHGFLLYGPPGCSKTMTAKAIATESGLNFIAVKGPELVSKYVGESEYKIREIFRKARAASPSVIFFDEIDSIAPNREGGGGHEGLNTVATLLNEMDGVEDVQRVLVLAATNRPDAIDPALLRPGRLGTTLYVGPPNHSAVVQILQMRISRTSNGAEHGLALNDIASKIIDNGCFSGADVGALCDMAGLLCATEAVQQGTPVDAIKITQAHMEEAYSQARPSLSVQQLSFLQHWAVGNTG